MITVVDQVRPWFTPSSTLANTIQLQRRRPDQQQRHGKADDPAGDEDRFAADTVRQRAGEEVGDRLDRAERGDERERGGEGREVERAHGEQREHGAFLADHPADERVDADEQRELREVLAQAETNGLRAVACVRSSFEGAARSRRPVLGAAGEHRHVSATACARGSMRRSWRVRRDRTSRSPDPAERRRPRQARGRARCEPRAGTWPATYSLRWRTSTTLAPTASGPTISIVDFGEIGCAPGGHAAVELTGEVFVADVQALAHEIGAILVVAEHEHERPVGLDEPAEPTREHGPQLDRQRARDVPGREVLDRADVDENARPRRSARGTVRRRVRSSAGSVP